MIWLLLSPNSPWMRTKAASTDSTGAADVAGVSDEARERERWQRAGSKLLTNICNFVAVPTDSSTAPYRRPGAEAALGALVAANAVGEGVIAGHGGSGMSSLTLSSPPTSGSASASVSGLSSSPLPPPSCLAAIPLLCTRLAELTSGGRGGAAEAHGGGGIGASVRGDGGGGGDSSDELAFDEGQVVSALRILIALVKPLATAAGSRANKLTVELAGTTETTDLTEHVGTTGVSDGGETSAGGMDDREQLLAWSGAVFRFALYGQAEDSRAKAAQCFALICR